MRTPHYILSVQVFYHRLEVVKEACNFLELVYFLSHVWAQRLLFFQGGRKTPVSWHDVKIICKGLQIALLNNLSILLFTLS